MATREDIERHYDSIGAMHALRLEDVHGGFPDYTCAYFNGDFGKSLAQAQEDKHAWIFEGLGLGRDLTGKRLLDIGSGWGPILNAVRKRGGSAIGLTLSPGQVAHCRRHGLDVRLKDYKHLVLGELCIFDGIVSLGALEHFCSVEEKLAGQQEDVYRHFFKICAERLPPEGRLYLQTMTWGRTVPDYGELSLAAPPDSTEAILARLEHFYPGSWLPNGLDQLVECASEHFTLVSSTNGRLDYLQTLGAWDAASRNLWKPRTLLRSLYRCIPLAFRILTDPKARIQFQSFLRSDQRSCFEREIMSHERIFFARKPAH